MTAINQNFSMYAGKSYEIVVSVTKEDGSALSLTGSTVKWKLKNSTTSIYKDTTSGITLNDSDIHIKLDPVDTSTSFGTYYHEGELTDSLGNVSTIFTGIVSIQKSII